MNGWYIAKTNARKESWLEVSLAHAGVGVFVPRITVRKRGLKTVEPLFPTYVFCKFDPSSPRWVSVSRTPGLQYFLSADGQPSRIPDSLVDAIAQRVSAWNSAGEASPRFHRGDRVRIESGPFAGLDGIFDGYVPSRQRCRTLLHIVGRVAPVELNEADLASAAD